MIDSEASDDATVIRVDSVNSHGTLLAVVQVIADLNLVIRKAYFSSDGNWFMDGQSVPKSSWRYFSSSFMSEKQKMIFLIFIQCSMSPTVTATRFLTPQPYPTSRRYLIDCLHSIFV